MKQLILFNGPPRSGKDTAADFVWHRYRNVRRFKLSQPLKDGIKAFFNLTDAQVQHLEKNKSIPDPLLFNQSYRDVQISMSEHWAKDRFGMRVFGNLAQREVIASPSSLFVCSDSGFAYEAEPLLKLFGLQNVLLVRLHRDSTSYEGDSRSYIELPGVFTVNLINPGTRDEYHSALESVVSAWLNRNNT